MACDQPREKPRERRMPKRRHQCLQCACSRLASMRLKPLTALLTWAWRPPRPGERGCSKLAIPVREDTWQVKATARRETVG